MLVINIQKGIFGQIFVAPPKLYCSVNLFLLSVTGLVSPWVTVLISLDRFIAIYYPFKVHIYCTRIRTYVTILAFTTLACLFSIPYFYNIMSDVFNTDQEHMCQLVFVNVLIFVFKWSVKYILHHPAIHYHSYIKHNDN